MTFVHVTVHHRTHTCPADPEPHPYNTARTIVAVVDGGPCRHPVTIHSGDTTAVIPCGRHEPRRAAMPGLPDHRHRTADHLHPPGPPRPAAAHPSGDRCLMNGSMLDLAPREQTARGAGSNTETALAAAGRRLHRHRASPHPRRPT